MQISNKCSRPDCPCPAAHVEAAVKLYFLPEKCCQIILPNYEQFPASSKAGSKKAELNTNAIRNIFDDI